MGAFESRQEMTEAFEALTSDRHRVMREYTRYEFGKNPLKSYLVEVDFPDSLSPFERVSTAFEGDGAGYDISATDDSSLVRIITNEHSLYMVDCLDSRFWVVHTTDSAKNADSIMRQVTHSVSVDSLWLPSEFLHALLLLGQPYGFSTSFNTDYFTKRPRGEFRTSDEDEYEDEVEQELGIQSLSIQMSGTDAGRALDALESSDGLSAHLALSRAKVKHGVGGEWSTDDVRYDGRTVARGESFFQHRQLLRLVHERYRSWLVDVEAKYRVMVKDGRDGPTLEGRPLTIVFPTSLPDSHRFYQRLLSGVRPFRLWGVPQPVNGDYMRVVATDMHGGATLALDLAPSFMRVYLYCDTCANTVLRLLVNLQQSFNTNLVLTDGERELSMTLNSSEV